MSIRKTLACLCLALGAFNAHAQVMLMGNNDPILSTVADGASRFFNTQGPVLLTVKECGELGAWWDGSQQIVVCREVLTNAQANAAAFLQKGLVSQASAIKIAAGQIFYVVFHELAHALIQRHKLPYTGRQEDVADQFAANILLNSNDPDLYVGAINLASQFERKQGFKIFFKSELSDEHALGAQRKFQMLCWAYGRNPQSIHQMALNAGMPQRRLDRCPEEYADMKRNIERIFSVALKKQS